MKPWTWYILIAVAAIAVVYWWRKRRALPVTDPDKAAIKPAQARQLDLKPADFPLKSGSQGIEVLYLQGYLNRFKGESLYLDGVFNTKTWEAFKRNSFFAGSTNGELITQEVYNLVIRPHQGMLRNWIQLQGIYF